MLASVARHVRGNLVAYLALLFALGGTSYAAGSKLLPRNSVGSPQVIDRSLLAKDFKPGQLPAGEKGNQGPEGKPGRPGTDATFAGWPAGGDLAGTYPDPQIKPYTITSSDMSATFFRDLKFDLFLSWVGSSQPVADADAFKNGWHDVGGDYAVAAWSIDTARIVRLRGLITGGAVPSEAFRVKCGGPADYKTHVFASVSGNEVARITVSPAPAPNLCPSRCYPPPNDVCLGMPPDAVVTVAFAPNDSVTLDGISWYSGPFVQ